MRIPHDKLRGQANRRAERGAQLLRLAHACCGVCEGSGGAQIKGFNACCCAAETLYSATARELMAAAQGCARLGGMYQAAAVLTHGLGCGGCGGLGHAACLRRCVVASNAMSRSW